MEWALLLVSLGASMIGAVCGIGGGVIIKPVLDMLALGTPATISFLSGCTVLSMSMYSIVKAVLSRQALVDFKVGTPLALGAALGGVLGKIWFVELSNLLPTPQKVGGYQALCLMIITFFTMVYTLRQNKIKTLHVSSVFLCMIIGLALGVCSSFLGIGGGPINLVVLYYFFSMPTKKAAQNSLYIILISQITALLTTFATNSVPPFQGAWLAIMVTGGILGGILGRVCNRRLHSVQIQRLFLGCIAIIIFISGYNAVTGLLMS
ncbi:MAG: sulfite exporter TauE/SafE family protein [Oscillospiraceae bacterium]|nr:sulfite exporter TauE/SafE family protein [Oscillospiraceae bacterium]